jgi:outer membrane lipoprotein-sorting protein
MARGILFALMTAILLTGPRAFAADDLSSVLKQLNAAAQNFRSTSADSEVDVTTTLPIENTDVQKGTVYYQRTGKSFKMAAHIQTINGQPAPKIYMYSNGQATLWEGGNLNQVTTFAKAGNWEGYLVLGFGASGTELEQKWEIKYDGEETIDGVKTAKLELVAKDPEVRKKLPRVTVWIDTTRGVSLKQVFDQGQGDTRTCTYSNFKMNQSLPGDAFTYKTDKNTNFIRT